MKTPEEKLKAKRGRSLMFEGLLYFYTAFAGALLMYLGSDDSYKYIDPVIRFWIVASLGSSVTGANAVKAFRSMTYGRAFNDDNKPPAGDTTFTTKPPTQP